MISCRGTENGRLLSSSGWTDWNARKSVSSGPSRAFHAVAEEGVAYRQIAEAIGRQLDVPARSITAGEAATHFGPLAMWVQNNGPASNEWTRRALAWTPSEAGMVADIERADDSR